MPASRTVHYYDTFSFAIHTEQGKRNAAPDGTPLEEPEEIELQVLVLYDQHPIDGIIERRYRFLPETWAAIKEAVNGGVATADLLHLPPGAREH